MMAVALAVLIGIASPARGQSQNPQVTSLLDPQIHLGQAQTLLDSNQPAEGSRHLQVSLEVSSVGTPTWENAYRLAMEKRSDLFAQTLAGANFSVPLALLPEDLKLYAPDEVFAIPPYGPFLEFLDKDRRETVLFHLKNNQWRDACHIVENLLDDQRNHIPALLLVAILYERVGQLALAEKRYAEVLNKAGTFDSQASFTALFGIFRTQYRRQDFKTAETTLQRYIKEAQAYLSDALERFRTSSSSSDSLYWVVLEGRRHLVEGFNSLGVLKAFRNNDQEAFYCFEQARLLAPGAITLTLNTVWLQQKLLMIGTARQTLSRLAESLSSLERSLLGQLDRSIDEGTLDLGLPLSFRDLLRNMIARIRVRQALFEQTLGESKASGSLLRQAVTLADRSPHAHYYFGLLLQTEDRQDEAIREFKQAMACAAPTRLRNEAKHRLDELFEREALRAQQAKTRDDQIKEHLEEKLDSAQLQILRRDLADGVQMLERGEYSKAKDHFSLLAEYHKDSLDIFRWLGFANQEMGRCKDALLAYDRALAIDKADPWALSQKAIVLYEYSNDLPNALALADEACRIKGDDPIILSNYGWLLVSSGEIRKGIELLRSAIEKNSKDPRHHFRLGMAYYNQGVYPFAVSQFDQVRRLFPKHRKASVFLGLSYARLGRISEAMNQLSASLELMGEDSDLKGLVTENLALLRGGSSPVGTPGPKGHPDRRLPLTRDEIQRLNTAHTTVTQAQSLVLKGELTQARALLSAAYKDLPTAVELGFAYVFLLLQGKQADDLKIAGQVLSGMLDVNTQEMRAYYLMAHLQFVQGGLTESLDSLQKAGSLPSGCPYFAFLEAIGRRWSQVLDVDRNDQSAMDALGLTHLLQGRLQEAQELLTRSSSVEGKRLLGEVYLRQFILNKKQLTFQQAKQALTESSYSRVDQLDAFWKLVMNPSVSRSERVVLKEKRSIPAKDLEGWWRIDPSTKQYAAEGTNKVGLIDVNKTPLFNRRWSQIDQFRLKKMERLEAEKTRELSEKELERKETEEKEREEKIRAGIGGPERPKVVPPPVPGLPEPNAAILVGDPLRGSSRASRNEAAPKNQKHQLKGLAGHHLEQGLDLVKSGRLTEAIREFQTAVSLDPSSNESSLSLALALIVTGENSKAKAFLTSKRRTVSGAVVARLLGHIAWREVRLDDAARAFGLAVAEPSSDGPTPKRGRRRVSSKRRTDHSGELRYLTISRKTWERMLVDNPTDFDANLNIALLDFFAGKGKAALDRLDRIVTVPEGALAYAEISLSLVQQKFDVRQLDKALEVLGNVEGTSLVNIQNELRRYREANRK